MVWDPPTGSGSELIIKEYIVTIFPKPISHPITNVAFSSPFYATLNYNITYDVTITAVNCVAEAIPSILNNIEYNNIEYN